MATVNLTEDCLRTRPVTDAWTVKLRLGIVRGKSLVLPGC